MATTGKKEYSIKINGVTQSINDVTKLEKAVNALDGAIDKNRSATVKSVDANKAKTKALTEEEKAAKKLADIEKRIAEADSAANKEVIRATQELKERTREVRRAVIQEDLAADSIAAMGMQLTDLRLEYEALSAAERANEEIGVAMLAQIQALDAEYKALRESTGNFRDSVGNYEKALKGLGDLKDGLDKVGTGTTGLAASIAGSNEVLNTFNDTTKAVSIASEGLQGTIALGTQAMEIYNAVVKENIIQEKAAAIIEGVRTIQLKAKAAAEALATKGTIAATIAQGAFNIVAAANPYVLLALALVAVVGALFLFASRTSVAIERQKELNELQSIAIDQLDRYGEKQKKVSAERVTQLQNEIDVLKAAGAQTGKIRDAENRLHRERVANNARLRGFYGNEISDLEKNRKEVEKLIARVDELNKLKAQGQEKVWVTVDVRGNMDRVDINDAIDAIQGQVDNIGRKITIATELQTEQKELENEARVAAAARAREDRELRKTQAAVELNDFRALQDAKDQILDQTYENRIAALKRANEREKEDLRNRLKYEEDLTARSRALINAKIKALEGVLAVQLRDLRNEMLKSQLETARESIDQQNALIIGATDRQVAEIKTRYERQIHDLENRLRTERDLTVSQQAWMREMIVNAAVLRDRELAAVEAVGLEQRNSATLAKLDESLNQQRDRITKFTGELQVRDKTGLQLINVEATRKNLADINKALSEYMYGLVKYQIDLKEAHKATLATLQEGTPEYQAELDKYAKATADNTKKIKQAQIEQANNTKTSQQLQIEYYREAAAKITAIAQETIGIFQQGADIFAATIEAQLESLNTSLDAVNTKYDDVKALQEKTVEDVNATEAQLQQASGGTAEALKGQLADQMRARNEAQRQEQRLAKEKEKLEADIRKKEKAQKRLELISNIGQATANGAQAVTQALAAYPPPFNYIAAGITAGLAAVQIGIMTKQLIKLADGGEIVGPSHANGGVPIGLGYEAEGGEFMINKDSYAANKQLVQFINESKGAISAEDLVGMLPGNSPMIVTETVRDSNQDVIDAINDIDMQPVVAVTDINDVNNQLVTVQELAGY